MAKGEVIRTYADNFGAWHAEVEAAEGNGMQEVYGCTWQTVCNRAARAIHAEIKARQGQEPPMPKVEFLSLSPDGYAGKWIALFRER